MVHCVRMYSYGSHHFDHAASPVTPPLLSAPFEVQALCLVVLWYIYCLEKLCEKPINGYRKCSFMIHY